MTETVPSDHDQRFSTARNGEPGALATGVWRRASSGGSRSRLALEQLRQLLLDSVKAQSLKELKLEVTDPDTRP